MQDTERTASDKGGDGVVASEVSGAAQPSATSRSWSDEEKAWIVQESFERGTTVAEVDRLADGGAREGGPDLA